MSKTVYKPWLNHQDTEDVFFASIHLFADEKFYPGSGDENVIEVNPNIVNICLTPIGPGPWDDIARQKLSTMKRENLVKIASQEFHHKVKSLLLPKLQSFQPDILLISAGFDTHYDDFYHFLHEDDIHWITQELCQLVDSVPDSIGVVSILEGGYSLSSPIVSTPTNATASSAASSEVGKKAAGKQPAGTTTASHNTRRKGTATATAATTTIAATAASAVTSTTIGQSSSSPVVTKKSTPTTKFAQQPGDGGLVKG